MIKELVLEKTCEAVRSLYGQEIAKEIIGLEWTRKEIEGDLTIVVFPLLKISRKPPEATAKDLGDYLAGLVPFISRYHVIKGFLNLVLKDNFWTDFLGNTLTDEQFGFLSGGSAHPAVVEFSSPNTNKPLHLGHIRNNLLGESVAELLKANGKKVVKVNLVNDRGIHICKSMLAYRKWGNNETPASSGLKGDHLAGKYYVLFDQRYREETAALVASGMDPEEAEKQAPLIREAQQMLQLWEKGDEEVMELWRTMNGWVYEGFDKTYKTLGIVFDKTYYESETYSIGKKIVLKGLEEGFLLKKEDDSIWADLREDGMDEKVLMRSDGTSVYMTQDLGTATLRFDEFDPGSMIYVVGNEQNYHFAVLKLVLKKLGYKWADTIHHLSYGMVELPQGKMKSREGTVVDADDLLQEMFETAEATTRELGKADELGEREARELFRIVGLGALKYFILKVDPKKNMLFDPAESIDFNGNTGPFIQYTHARTRSLLKKAADAGFIPDPKKTTGWLEAELLAVEKEIIKLLYQFPETVRSAGDELSPAVLANYAYDLAKTFNQFYQEVPVLKEEKREKLMLRLCLSALTADVIRKSMNLLGIEVPERM